jgi:cobalt-zinc-cadmium efflux system outer membrane protein
MIGQNRFGKSNPIPHKNRVEKNHVLLLILFLAGCTTQSPYDRSYVSAGIKKRTDYQLGPTPERGRFSLPEGISLDDGLSEDEAVSVALWNNAQLQADLATLGFARADLIEANMLPNPVFSLLFPVGPKLLEADLGLSIDVLWQRPHRIAAAKLDAQGLSENLVEHGLGLIRDIQTTYSELWSVREQVRLANEDAQLQAQIAEIARGHVQAGDISELEAQGTFVESLRAADAFKRLSKEAEILKNGLNHLLGITSDDMAFDIVAPDLSLKSVIPLDELQKTALAARPDLRAAELGIEAAGERVGWERSKVYNFIAIIDAKDEGEDSLTVGPGLDAEIPIFNQNQGGIARAKAELEQAARQYEAVRQSIILQVQQARSQYISAQETFELWSHEIVPSLQTKVEQTQKSYKAGEVLYVSVLKARRELLEANMHLLGLTGDLHRRAAELNYSVGKKVI